MGFIQVQTEEGAVRALNTDHIVDIAPRSEGRAHVLMTEGRKLVVDMPFDRLSAMLNSAAEVKLGGSTWAYAKSVWQQTPDPADRALYSHLSRTVDWKLLREQKAALAEHAGKDWADGLLGLIDTIQDYAADELGIEGVFEPDDGGEPTVIVNTPEVTFGGEAADV